MADHSGAHNLSGSHNLSGLMDLIPIDDIARQLGVSEDVATAAVNQAIPAIVGGMAANAEDTGGAKSLEKALASHAGRVPAKRPKVAEIDTADGEKIVSNVFGPRKNDVVAAVAKTDRVSAAAVTPDLISKILPIIAPIVISFIASQFFGKKEAPSAPGTVPAPKSSTPSGGGIGDLLGGLLGGSGGKDLLGGVLGGLLGGGKK